MTSPSRLHAKSHPEEPLRIVKYLLDTGSVSNALRGQGDVGVRIRKCDPSDLRISAITLAELRYEADRKGARKLRGLLGMFAAAIEVVPFDELAAAASVGSVACLPSKGH